MNSRASTQARAVTRTSPSWYSRSVSIAFISSVKDSRGGACGWRVGVIGIEGWVNSCVGAGGSSAKDGKGDRALAGVEVENADASGEAGCTVLLFKDRIARCNSEALLKCLFVCRLIFYEHTYHFDATESPRSEHSLIAFRISVTICVSTSVTVAIVDCSACTRSNRRWPLSQLLTLG
jgi:hypothetical protein